MGVDSCFRYDGTMEGWLCCVFETYRLKAMPQQIIGPEGQELSLFGCRQVETVEAHADRVRRGIREKLGEGFWLTLRHLFCTCLPDRELVMLDLTCRGFRYGPLILQVEGDPVVAKARKALTRLFSESHLLKGFIRFSVQSGVLVTTIGPKNFVLPYLAAHFRHRFPEERFLIYDEIHRMALVYRPHETAIVPMEDFRPERPDEAELACRRLWRLFYDTIEIKPRHNPKCRQTHMPKRYWKYMTEFTEDAVEPEEKSIPGGKWKNSQ